MEYSLRQEIESKYQNAVEWTTSRLSFFTPSDFTSPETMKEGTELALFYCFAKIWLPAAGERYLLTIRDFLRQWLSNPLLTQWLLKSPSHYSPSAVAYLAVRATGERIPEFENTLRRLHSAGFPQCMEQVPYRALEFEYMLWKSGFAKRKFRLGPRFRASALALTRNPIYLTDAEVYSITHSLLYLTDFAGPSDCHPSIRERSLPIVSALLVHFRRIRDWDITGELLLNLLGLDNYNDVLFTSTMRALCRAQTSEGAVPGPVYSASDPQAGSKEYIFKHCYHTTLVSMLAWAGYLYRTPADART